MAHGYTRTSNPYSQNSSLSGYLAGKVRSAFDTAGEERRGRDEEIDLLEKKEELDDEEKERLAFLKKQQGGRKGGIFGKALMSEFGGDRRRRTMGMFSKNPDAANDPSLTKAERFSAVLDRSAPPQAPEQLELNLSGRTSIKEQLARVYGAIGKGYDSIADRVSQLASAEKETAAAAKSNTKFTGAVGQTLSNLKDYFNKDLDLKKSENDIATGQLELALEAEENEKNNLTEARVEKGEDLSGLGSVPSVDRTGGKDGGMLGGLGNLLKNLNPFGGKKNQGFTQYARDIGPTSMQSVRPWARAKPMGLQGNADGFAPLLRSRAITPRPVSKFSEGGIRTGIYDNPTNFNMRPGDAVIPLNRNNALADMFKSEGSNKSMVEPMTEAMQLPTQVGGGLLISMLRKLTQNLGGLSSFIAPTIKDIAKPIALAFGLPTTITAGLVGGNPAQAGGIKFNMGAFTDKNQASQMAAAPPPATPQAIGGADLGSTMRAGETIQRQMNNAPGGFIQGGSGLGSEGGQNTNAGYAKHYHLSPPSNDEQGWAQARSIAHTAASIMLDRGSTIYFGNIKESGTRENLADQIAREQVAHSRPGRTQGGIDIQENNPTGGMRMKFPLKVTNVSQDISGGSGRTARIVGTNVTLAHGAVGSANSIETQVARPSPAATRNPIQIGSDGPSGPPPPQAADTGLTSRDMSDFPAIQRVMQINEANQSRQRLNGRFTQFSVFDPTEIDSLLTPIKP